MSERISGLLVSSPAFVAGNPGFGLWTNGIAWSASAAGGRWRVACHEAGHAVVAIAQGGQCTGVLLTAFGGLTCVDELHGDAVAIMIAAGDAAEVLAEQHPAPKIAFRTPEAISSGDLPPTQLESSLAAICKCADIPTLVERYEPDASRLALWAISGREEEPDSWAGRVLFARTMAAKAVMDNENKILTIARRLYVDGVLSGRETMELAAE